MVEAGAGLTVPEYYSASDVVRIPMRDFNPRRTVALFRPHFAPSGRLVETGKAFERFAAGVFGDAG